MPFRTTLSSVSKLPNRSGFVLGLLCSVVLYEVPAALTLMKVGWESIPPVLEADQNLYLNLSAIQHVSATEVLNPWYGTRVLAVDVPHLLFPVTFVTFRAFHSVVASWTAALLIWTALWMALTFCAAFFCLKSFFPDVDRRLTSLAALGLLVLQSPIIYLQYFRGIASSGNLFAVPLPCLRFAIPQVTLPCVLAYWGLQTMALKRPSVPRLAGMAILQFLVCVSFPYFLPVLALGTGIAILLHRLLDKATAWMWPTTLGFAFICGALDVCYAALAGLGKSHANVHIRLQFRPEMIIPSVRPYMLLLALAAGLVFFFSKTSKATQYTAAGLGLASALFGFADVFFPPEAQMLQHPNYLIGVVTWLILFVALWPLLLRLSSHARVSLALCCMIALGAWESYSSYRSMLPFNVFQADAIREAEQMNLNDRDLVIAPSRFADDVSSWIPLMSRARVLFTGDGENILSATETRTLQTTRQALYLMLRGMTLESVEARTQDNSSDSQIHPFLQQTDQTFAASPLRMDQVKLRRLLRDRMVPLFSNFEDDQQWVSSILGGYDRIVVIDTDSGFFDESALLKWMSIDASYERNGVRVFVCHFDQSRNSAERDSNAPPLQF
jgi:hypothetical protein